MGWSEPALAIKAPALAFWGVIFCGLMLASKGWSRTATVCILLLRFKPKDGRAVGKKMFDAELEDFKTKIDLRAYAASQGYQLDKRESWRGSAVMRHSSGDKVIIKRDSDNHYVFFSVHRDASGSIIDFVQAQQGLSLGAVRKELRPWIGAPPVAVPVFPALAKTAKDRVAVETKFARMRDAPRHPYLETERGLPPALLESSRFAGHIRIDDRGNAVFPHFDTDGLCGYEIKNKSFTGFSAGGAKGLWLSREEAFDNCLVFCEAAIDALSHAALFPDERTRYASIGGKPNPEQPALIGDAVKRMPKHTKIVAAMDADEDGGKLADIVRDAVVLTGRDDLIFVSQEPRGFKDWNDQLRGKQPDFFPTARPSSLDVA
jgi:hypothetical protein